MAPYINSVVANIPTLTKTLLINVLLISGMGSFYIYHQQQLEPDTPLVYAHCSYLGLIPGSILQAPWTIVTSIFFENTLLAFISSMVVLLFCGKYLERAWGSRELLRDGDEIYLYYVQINGMAGVFSGFLVAFKLLIPEHRLSLIGGRLAIRVKDLLGVATITSIICLILFKAIVFYNLVNIGWVIGWVYLRFFQHHENGSRGDRTEAFALVTFFPPFLRPVIGFLSNFVHHLFVKFNILPSIVNHQRSTMYDMEHQTPGSARAEAERRRALALKALDQRLSKPSTINIGSSSSVSPQPSSSATIIGSNTSTSNIESVNISSKVINTSDSTEKQQSASMAKDDTQ
ncbi:hypothetical protein BC941DRAFT_450329 [Chlamydoabsidia padenii]|nr:hypothetical protein BC941DRAFT_450329 [Chlamydoabsidia padenii]